MFKKQGLLAVLLVSVLALSGCFGKTAQNDTTLRELVLAADACYVKQGDSVNLQVKGLAKSKKEVEVPNPQWKLSDDSKGTLTPSADKTKAVFTADAGAKGSVIVTVSSGDLSASFRIDIKETVDPSEPCKSGGLPIVEEFDVADIAEFFSADYKDLPTDPTQPLYVRRAGSPSLNEDGHLVLSNARFTIGMPEDRADTTSSDAGAGGALDLSKPYRITIEVASTKVLDPEKPSFFVYIDNNTTSQGNSLHGNDSRYFVKNVGDIDPGEVLVIESSLGTKSSFLQFRAESGAEIVIKRFTIAYR